MSLVGTRPPTVDEWEQYELHHRSRMSTKPGITGMWQVSGRSDITDFEEVVRLDTEYIENWTIGLDLPELFKEMIGKECCAKDKDIQEFYADKVQFGAISTVLKPDKPVRFSIKDKLIRTGYKASYMEIAEFKMGHL